MPATRATHLPNRFRPRRGRDNAATKTERATAAADAKQLGETALLLARDLSRDLVSSNSGVATAARRLRDELVSVSDSYHTLFTGLGVDREVSRRVTSDGALKILGFTETGRFSLDDRLEINLGEHQAMVQVVRTVADGFESLIYAQESPTVEDGTISEAAPSSTDGGAATLEVNGTSGAVKEALVRFNLAEVADLSHPQLLADAKLKFQEISGSGAVDVLMWDGLLSGGTGSASDWDESNLTWDRVHTTLDLSGKIDEFTQVGTWTAGSTTELDLTDRLQRATQYGDANGDGEFAALGNPGDIDAFHMAVTNWDDYVALYGPQTTHPDELVSRLDGGLGDGIIDSYDIGDFFRRYGVSLGDFNLDGTVDGLDYSVWASNFGETNPLFTQGDGNFDAVIDAADYTLWRDNEGVSGLTDVTPEATFWLRPVNTATDVTFASQEHATVDGPTLEIEAYPDLVVDEFSVSGDDLIVGYRVFGENFTNVKIQVYKVGDPDVLLHETAVQSGSLGQHAVQIPTSILASVVAGDQLYAKILGTPDQGSQVNTENDTKEFEFGTSSTLVVNSLDDVGVDNLISGKITLREALEADKALGWIDTIIFDPSLFIGGAGQITLGDHTGDGVADGLFLEDDVAITGPGAELLTVSGAGAARVFEVVAGTTASIGWLAIRDGYGQTTGGGITNWGHLTLDTIVATDNTSTNYGGAVFTQYGSLTVKDSLIENNSSSHGGAIYVAPAGGHVLWIENSSLVNNTATLGGAMEWWGDATAANNGPSTIVNTTISGNEGTAHTGALRIIKPVHLDLINSTVTKNTTPGKGGGFGLLQGATMTAHNSILSGNFAPNQPGYKDGQGWLTTDSSYNLIGTIQNGTTGGAQGPGNQFGVNDPGLAPLGNYGGATKTHLVYLNSPAIDAGSDAIATSYALNTDQRGFDRLIDIVGANDTSGNSVDIGAYETIGSSTIEVSTLNDFATPEAISLREAISIARETGATEITFADGLAGTITLQEELVVDFDVTITGPGADLLAISGNDQHRVISFTSGIVASLSGVTMERGYVTDQGGGIKTAADLTLDGVVVRNNVSEDQGGGLYGDVGNLTVRNSTFEGNTAQRGAGLLRKTLSSSVNYSTQIEGSSFHHNQAVATTSPHWGTGGGLEISGYTGHDVDIVNSTFSQNQAVKGAGMIIYGAVPVEIVNSTITLNDAAPNGLATSNKVSGGGIDIWDATNGNVTLHNTIVAQNSSTATYRTNLRNSVTTNSSYNLIEKNYSGGGSGGITDGVAGNIVLDNGAYVGLAALGNYGGPTLAHALLPGSLAIDAGSDAIATNYALDVDQRNAGYRRQLAGGTDIGAVEANVIATSPTTLEVWGTDLDDVIDLGSDTVTISNLPDFSYPIDPAVTDVIAHGLAGDDTIIGGTKQNVLYGDEGDDTLIAGPNGDQLFGGNDDDSLFGNTGHDIIFGELGNDEIHGNGGNDVIQGGLGADDIDSGLGTDVISIIAQETFFTDDIADEDGFSFYLPDGTTIPVGEDTDGDGLGDDLENYLSTDPNDFDSDGDLLSDGFEASSVILDPNDADTDNDGTADSEEDSDGDGLSNLDEQIYSTDPASSDSDGDGTSDSDETSQGSDPNDSFDSGIAPPEDQLVNLHLLVGDFSDSNSERYDLTVGPIRHQATDFGLVQSDDYVFHKGKTHPVNIVHRGTDPEKIGQSGYPDYDYSADIDRSSGESSLVIIEDPDDILRLGWYAGDDPALGGPFYAAGKTAYVHLPLVDLDIIKPDGSEVPDELEEDPGGVLILNDDDDDEDGLIDSDSTDTEITGGDDDFLEIKLKQLMPTALQMLPGSLTLNFDSSKVRIWKQKTKGEEVLSGITEFDLASDHLLYVEGIANGIGLYDTTDIQAIYIPGELSDDYEILGVSEVDTITLNLWSFNIDLDVDWTASEQTPLLLTNSVLTNSSLTEEYQRLAELDLFAVLPAEVDPSLYWIELSVSGDNRLWEDPYRIMELDPAERIEFGSSSGIQQTFYVDAGADGEGAVVIEAALKSNDPFVQLKKLPKKVEDFVHYKIIDKAHNKIKEWIEDAPENGISAAFDDFESLFATRIAEQKAQLNTGDSDYLQILDLLEQQEAGLPQWVDQIEGNAKKVTFDLFKLERKASIPLPAGSFPPSSISEIFEQKTRAPLENENVVSFKVDVKFNEAGWQDALGSVLNGNSDSFKDWLLSPQRVDSFSVRANRIHLDDGSTAHIEIGTKDFANSWEEAFSRPEKNRFFIGCDSPILSDSGGP